MMKTSNFSFNIPEERIAQNPPSVRGTSRLMVLDRNSGGIEDSHFRHLPDLLPQNSLLVFNNSKVRKARIYAKSSITNGKVEFLFIERIKPKEWKVLVNKSKKQKIGKMFDIGNGISATITGDDDAYKIISLNKELSESYFDEYGHVPLPPYIKRKDRGEDAKRYQTIYFKEIGSSAAPTAGLHFTDSVINRLKEKGIEILFVTLHVGIGTFLPIRTENVEDHVMHEEKYYISENTANIIEQALNRGINIIGVGTTVVRTLESAYSEGKIISGNHKTSLYIYPGYKFKVISGMLTNFHTPKSTLLVMVSAFAGDKLIKKAYSHALENDYRFFSYGDAMLIL